MDSSTVDFDVVERRIRALTHILHQMQRQGPPTSHRKEVRSFLRHFATLLICDDKYDTDAKKDIAVTGGFAEDKIQALVVTQNPFKSSDTSQLGVEMVEKLSMPFDEVVKSDANVKDLRIHIAELWAALASFDLTATDKADRFRELGTFVIARSFRKFSTRFNQDKRLFGGRTLVDKIEGWKADMPELHPRWIDVPQWLLDLCSQSLLPFPGERHTASEGVRQWELSDGTKKHWAMILRMILLEMRLAIEEVKQNRRSKSSTGRGQTEAERAALKDVYIWCDSLYRFIKFKGVVKTLLTETNLAAPETLHTYGTLMTSVEDDADESEDLRREPQESYGEQVLRFLQSVVAWHAALNGLCIPRFIDRVTTNLAIGVVEVPPATQAVSTLPEISEEYRRRFSDASQIEVQILEATLRNYHPRSFTGTVHAEATLMGLLAYFAPYAAVDARPNYGIPIQNLERLRQILEPATTNSEIAVGKKCCWCCDKLGAHLGHHLGTVFKLPGSHGIIYPWSPPKVGISLVTLQRLEKDLWDELHSALLVAIPATISRQSSGTSTDYEDVTDHVVGKRRLLD